MVEIKWIKMMKFEFSLVPTEIFLKATKLSEGYIYIV